MLPSIYQFLLDIQSSRFNKAPLKIEKGESIDVHRDGKI